jgi:RNA polymerase sigma factor (sigma-70 family)
MSLEPTLDAQAIEQVLAEARADLLRWCNSLVGNRESAEDLVQETLSIAWRSPHHPTQEGEFRAWLIGIARNVCLTWLRSQRRELAHRLDWLKASPPMPIHARPFEPRDPLDLDILLEQEELARLIEKGLAVLPDATRHVLVAKYIEEYSLAEIAAQLRTTPEAIAARLHRGKHALRRVLLMASPEDRALYGIPSTASADWQTTPIWCPDCGVHRLQGLLEQATGRFTLRCASCSKRTQTDFARWQDQELFQGLKTFRAALTRLASYGHAYYRQALASRTALCQHCGKPAQVRLVRDEEASGVELNPSLVLVVCAECRAQAFIDVDGLALCHPAVQRFWRQQQRIATRPQQTAEVAGRPALLSRFVSVLGAQQITVASDSETLETLHIGEDASHG